jgi:hypothetical protein
MNERMKKQRAYLHKIVRDYDYIPPESNIKKSKISNLFNLFKKKEDKK